MSRATVLDAPAKLNLTLEVLGRRGDGYHEIASVFATVALCDRVRVAPHRRLDVRIAPDVGAPPGDDLASRAVRALAERCARAPTAYVRIAKRIPVAAGLGGGSSDAAAVLRGLARAWRLDAGVDLAAIGAGLGSDVPFFIAGAPYAHVRGRGERVDPLRPPPPGIWVVLVRVPVRVRTADVYAALRSDERGRGERTAALVGAFQRGALTPATIREHLGNDLAAAAERVAPAIRTVREAAASSGITLALSGSGPTLFAVADDRANALRLARLLRRKGLRARPYALGITP